MSPETAENKKMEKARMSDGGTNIGEIWRRSKGVWGHYIE